MKTKIQWTSEDRDLLLDLCEMTQLGKSQKMVGSLAVTFVILCEHLHSQ